MDIVKILKNIRKLKCNLKNINLNPISIFEIQHSKLYLIDLDEK